jgi:hypothetical protein
VRGAEQGLTQREVAIVRGISERAVREAEKRAIRKLQQHPLLRHIWQQSLIGELDERLMRLGPNEIDALFGLARTKEEWRLVRRFVLLVQSCRSRDLCFAHPFRSGHPNLMSEY